MVTVPGAQSTEVLFVLYFVFVFFVVSRFFSFFKEFIYNVVYCILLLLTHVLL